MADATVSPPPMPATSPSSTSLIPKWSFGHTLSLLVILIVTALVNWFILSRLVAWVLTMVLLIVLTSIVANGVIGSWRGPLIDERNRISLSRLQMLLWTVLLLSGILTAVLSNLRASTFSSSVTSASGINNLVSIAIPSGLWILMGIATTSLVGAPLILSTKTANMPDEIEKNVTLEQLSQQNMDVSQKNIVKNGQILAYATADNARWADLFTGDETGNAAQFDLGKIQMFYFTFILVVVYGVALGILFQSNASIIRGFPDLDTGMLTLLGISHAGYLVNKAVPHSSTPTQQ